MIALELEKEIKLERTRQWRIKNKEHISEYNKNYKIKNKEKISNYNKLYRENNLDLENERTKKYHQQNPEVKRKSIRKSRYLINNDEFEIKLKNQNYVCAICKEPESVKHKNGNIKSLAVDHCHNTGKIRGLLCFRCNGTLGKVKEDINLLKDMIKYLEREK